MKIIIVLYNVANIYIQMGYRLKLSHQHQFLNKSMINQKNNLIIINQNIIVSDSITHRKLLTLSLNILFS